MFAPSDRRHLHVTGYCYRVSLGARVQEPIEQDHVLKWVPAEQGAADMFLNYQSWAVRLAWEERMQEK